MSKRTAILSSILTICLLTAGAAVAGPAADVSYSASGIHFVMSAHGKVTINVAGNDHYISRSFGAGESPFISLTDDAGNMLPDGYYKWNLTVEGKASGERPQVGNKHGLTESGTFSIANGGLVDRNVVEGGTNKDQVILDDLIVDGSACVGMDCVNGESFGFDTLRLKENNLRVRAVDTSSTSSFPSRDWQITFNDSSNGGANKFSIDDIDGGRTPFTIEAGAPSHSLYVDDGGRIGFGTSTPVADLHVKSGNTPTLRLEQDGSSGFTAQTWDVAGNEAGFFIRDATNGSTLPFRIIPGADSQALVIGANGNVGIGADTTPEEALEIRRTSGNARMILDAAGTGNSQFYMRTGGAADWRMTNLNGNGALLISREQTAGDEDFVDVVTVRNQTDATPFNTARTMSVAGDVEAAGHQTLSSRTYKTELVELDSQDVLSRVAGMPVSAWRYNWEEADGERHIGPMAEDFTEAFGVGDGKSIRLGDASGVAFAAIKGVLELVQEKDALIQALEARLAELEDRVDP
ncbi:MAG: tail fiber domain-containing protein [bacterium]|nr:tail fiber domain-containing protein [bacterium]